MDLVRKRIYVGPRPQSGRCPGYLNFYPEFTPYLFERLRANIIAPARVIIVQIATEIFACNAWPYEDSFWVHLAFAFLLYAAVASV